MNIIPYVRLKDNKTDGVIITFVETTTRIHDLKELEKLVSDHEILLDTISHDIKNPLSNLVLAIDLFKDGVHDESEFNDLIEIVDKALIKMHDLIIGLTEVRKGTHKYRSEAEILHLGDILEEVRLTLSDNIAAANVLLTSKINISEIIFSKRKSRTILYNLVHNAIKFKSEKRQPKIHVTTHKRKDVMIITVKDNGIGIKKKNLESVFTKYHRLENSIEGSGIGLYLVKEIVNNSEGRITVKSKPGIGTEFQIILKIK